MLLASTAEDQQHIWAAWWVLCAGVLQGAGLLVKDCIARLNGHTASWVWLMCALIIVICPLTLASSAVGTYFLQAGCRQQSVEYISILSIALGLNYAYSIILVALIVRFVREHPRRLSTRSPTIILQQRLIESPLTNDEIAKIPEYRATEVNDECPVCLDTISADMKIKACPTCFKRSHSSCINRSLAHKPLCPTCRTNWRLAHNL